MLQYFKLFFLLFMFFLSSCGGGSGSNYDGSSLNTISGTAAKGIIKNGIVKVYGVSNGTRDLEELASDNTDDKGGYSLDIKDYTGPIFVEVTADPNTTKMICDITPSCGETPFGEEIGLDSDFIIKAVVGKLEKNKPITANINTITSLVAAKVEAESNIDLTEISNANSQIANLFGMTGNLSEKPVIDITNEASLLAASEDVLNMAILNSALASSSVDDGKSITEGLNKLLEDFVVRDGQFLNNGADNEVSIEKIYANAKDMLNMNIFSNIEVDKLKVSISSKEAVASSMPSGSVSDAMPSEIPEAIHIDSAKALVEDIREFSLQATYENSEEMSVANELEQVISFVDSDDLNDLNDIFELAVKALEAAYIQTMNDLKDARDFKSFYKFERDGTDISVTISEADSSFFFSIDESINSIAVKLNANSIANRTVSSQHDSNGACHVESSEYDLLLKENVQASFQLEGSVIGEELKMNIENGTASIIYNCSFLAENGYNLGVEHFGDYFNILLDLNIKITEINTISEPLKFSGNLKFEDKLLISSVVTNTANNSSSETDFYSENSDLTLSGEFEKNHKKMWLTFVQSGNTEVGNSLNNDFDLIIAGTDANGDESSEKNVFNFFEILSFFNDIAEPAIESLTESLDIYDLADNSFGSGGISLNFITSKISGITGIDFIFSSNYGNMGGSLKIAFDKKRLHFNYDPTLENPELVVTNQNGTTLKLSALCFENEDCENIGSITVDNKQLATVSLDRSADVFVITYNDDTSEPLIL
jgi:hypothetical protein